MTSIDANDQNRNNSNSNSKRKNGNDNDNDKEITLAAANRSLFSDQSILDVNLQGTDGVAIYAIRGMLAARSPVFRSMLFGSFAEATSNNCDDSPAVAVVPIGYSSKTLSLIVEYCCTDNVEVLLTNSEDCNACLTADIVSLADAANYFALPVLKERIEDWACKWMQEKPTLAGAFLAHARACNSVPTIEKIAWDTITSKPKQSLLEEDSTLSTMNQPMLEEILQDGTIDADEITMFHILKRWAENGEDTHDQEPESRKRAASQMSKHLAFEHINPSDLCDIVEPSGFVTSEQVHQAYKLQALRTKQGKFAELYKRRRRFGRSKAPAIWESSGTDTLACTPAESIRTEGIQLGPGVRMSSGQWRWSIKIKQRSAWCFLGVMSTTHSILTDKWLGKHTAGWSYSSNGDAYYRYGSENQIQSEGHPKFIIDSIVTLTLDLREEGTLEASVNEGATFMLFSSMLSAFADGQAVGFLPVATILKRGSVQFLGYQQLA